MIALPQRVKAHPFGFQRRLEHLAVVAYEKTPHRQRENQTDLDRLAHEISFLHEYE
jgi:hypothetical protein